MYHEDFIVVNKRQASRLWTFGMPVFCSDRGHAEDIGGNIAEKYMGRCKDFISSVVL